MNREKRFYLMASALLFLGFFKDVWSAAPPPWFYTQNRDMEAHVVCRLIISKQYGILFSGGLTGQGAAKPGSPPVLLAPLDIFSTYIYGEHLQVFSPYLSHNGGQAMLLSLLDRCLPMSPFHKLEFYYGLVALLSASLIALVLVWIRKAAGPWAGWSSLAGALFSSWLTVFGRNLWWFLGIFYLPFLAAAYAVGRRKTDGRSLAAMVFAGVFTKCFLTGFEFITTTLLMMLIPLVYSGIAERWTREKTIRTWIAAGAGAAAGVGLSALILCGQIAAVTGSFRQGISHLLYAWAKRTSGGSQTYPAELLPSFNASHAEVLKMYLRGYYFSRITYFDLLILFGLASVVVLIRRQIKPQRAYVAATAFSLAAPLSWLILFKAHAFTHPHMDFIVWQMPFTLLGFGLVGLAIAPAESDRA